MAVVDAKEKISDLSQELQAAVTAEEYEEAARIRDEISELEEQVPEIRLRKAYEAALEEEDYKARTLLSVGVGCRSLRGEFLKRVDAGNFWKLSLDLYSEEVVFSCGCSFLCLSRNQ